MSRLPVRSDMFAGTLHDGHVSMTRFNLGPSRGARGLVALLLAVAVGGCAKKAAEGERTMSPDDAAGPVGGADLDALEAQLAAREEQLRALQAGGFAGAGGEGTRDTPVAAEDKGDRAAAAQGEPAPTAGSAPTAPNVSPAEPAPKNRCSDVCEIQAAICQLQDQICGLVPRHEGEPRYQRACERASADCTYATEACHACA